LSIQITVASHLRGVGLPLSARETESNAFSFTDYDQRYEFTVGIAAQLGRKEKWFVRIEAQDPEDEEAIATLKRLPTLPTSEFAGATYTRWSPFTVEVVEGSAKRTTDWIIGTITNAADRMVLNTEPPPPPVSEPVVEPVPAPVEVPAIPSSEPVAAPIITDDVSRQLIAAITGASDPRLALIEALAERGWASAELQREIVSGIRLEQGDPKSILEAAQQGAVLTPAQAQVVVRMAFSDPRQVSDELLYVVLDAAQAAWDHQSRTKLLEVIRNVEEVAAGITKFKVLAKTAPSELVRDAAKGLSAHVERGDTAQKKQRYLEIVKATLDAGSEQSQLFIGYLLAEGDLRPYDLWEEGTIRAAAFADEAGVGLLYQQAMVEGTEPDLRVVGQALVSLPATLSNTRNLSRWLKRWVDAGYDLTAAHHELFTNVAGALREWHCEHPTAAEASVDQISLQRLAQAHPTVAAIEAARSAIEQARKPNSPEAKREEAMAARFAAAKQYIELELVAKKRRIILVGSRPNKTSESVVDSFYELRKFPWIDWIDSVRGSAISRRELSDKIKGAACVAVITFTGNNSHARSGLTDDLAESAGKAVFRVKSASREDLKRGLIEVTEALARPIAK
jgi:hypothetical protein